MGSLASSARYPPASTSTGYLFQKFRLSLPKIIPKALQREMAKGHLSDAYQHLWDFPPHSRTVTGGPATVPDKNDP